MAGWKRRILGFTVISVGVCAALPFRNATTSTPTHTRKPVESPGAATSLDELTLQLTIPATPVGAPTPVRQQQPISDMATTKPAPQPQEVRRDELQVPPTISSAFEPLGATFPVATSESTQTKNYDEPDRLHRIADGDTLEALAERYLGDRDQWRTIFEANGALLTDREILPIGKEIKIPHAPSLSPDDDDHLVPIPPGLLIRE
jgi:nucleoid-associated protein YgaU